MKDYMRHEQQLQGEPVRQLTTYDKLLMIIGAIVWFGIICIWMYE